MEDDDNYEDDQFDENSIKNSLHSDNKPLPALPDIAKMFNIDLKLFGDTL